MLLSFSECVCCLNFFFYLGPSSACDVGTVIVATLMTQGDENEGLHSVLRVILVQ